MNKEEKSEKLIDKLTFRLTATEQQTVKQKAANRGISVSSLIRQSLQDFQQKNN